MLSDATYKKYLGRKNEIKALYSHNEPIVETEEREPNKGQFIYLPHACDLPDSWETPIGAIWACHGYRMDGRLCYDQWIVEYGKGTKYWRIYKRNIRA